MPNGIRKFDNQRFAIGFAKTMLDNGVKADVRKTDVSEYLVYFGLETIYAIGYKVSVN